MAIQKFDEGPTFGALLGGGVGSGISSGIKAILKERAEKKKQRNLFDLLKAGGLPENQAAAVAGAPPGLQKGLLWNLSQNYYGEQEPQQMEQQPQLQPQQVQPQPLQQDPLQQVQQPQLQQQAQPQQQKLSKKDLNSLKRVRKNLLKQSAKPEMKKRIVSKLVRMGLGEAEIDALMGTELTDKIAQFFLDSSGGNKKAARKLAKAFGYGV